VSGRSNTYAIATADDEFHPADGYIVNREDDRLSRIVKDFDD
jgi:hypothetical protein